ncbi:class I SAM-dependent methyltransferase [Paraflavitalea pollutisoli]|uniref:class I SAM-dependent methyltransferase n=1 Tax=Paraflavitalea pollutisoli TaxID=3034143 RepID=UPI0023EE0A5D|nr:class I SAM-dependent methyltransferase [Paraflavitalea sp. H1-2-19X]
MLTTSHAITHPATLLHQLIARGGPSVQEYASLTSATQELYAAYLAGEYSAVDLQVLQSSFSDDCLAQTLHGHSIRKPFGYAGDFLIIDKIYRQHVTTDERYANWDRLWHHLDATKAVRNRKDYFKSLMTRQLATGKSLQLLNVASGPARDLAELYGMINPAQLHTTCIEADERAIAYARTLNAGHIDQINFIQQNIFRYDAAGSYDIVWSAGLFDYFTDSVFVKILRRFMRWTKPGGEIIVGNFSDTNPSQGFMELFGDWFLHHRSAATLEALALEAGARKEQVSIAQEAAGVNLFLHIKL